MKKTQILIGLVLIVSLMIGIMQPTGVVRAAETKDIVILGTSDIHGNVDNYDYFSDIVPTGAQQRGLTKVWTYAQEVKASNPNVLLIDNGDTIQGTPLSYYFNVVDTTKINPLALAMNTMGYVSATVGNHEFKLWSCRVQQISGRGGVSAPFSQCHRMCRLHIPTLCDQGCSRGAGGHSGFDPSRCKILGAPENIVGCVFGDAVDAAKTYVPVMKAAGADVIVVAAHSGLDATYGYGREENFITYLANEVPGIDVILAGHDHAKLPSQLINGVLVRTRATGSTMCPISASRSPAQDLTGQCPPNPHLLPP